MKKILSIGQCPADNSAISTLLDRICECEISFAKSFDETVSLAKETDFDLVLINRILDANGEAGITLLSKLKQDPLLAETPAMLISNHQDAQQEAVRAGAIPGFGKADLTSDETRQKITRVLN